jgi:hypothetical protein
MKIIKENIRKVIISGSGSPPLALTRVAMGSNLRYYKGVSTLVLRVLNDVRAPKLFTIKKGGMVWQQHYSHWLTGYW